MTSSWSMTTLIVFALFSLLLQHVSAAPSPISVYTTTPLDPSIRLSPQPSLALNKSCPTGLPTLSVSSTQQQPLLGFGAALTETTAYNFALLKARNQSAYTELLNSLFAPYPLGIGISFLRVPITSCDLSLPTPGWSYDDTPGDLNLTHFNTSHGEAYQIPILQDIMALSKQHNTQLRLLGSPWSAPSWIKDSQVTHLPQQRRLAPHASISISSNTLTFTVLTLLLLFRRGATALSRISTTTGTLATSSSSSRLSLGWDCRCTRSRSRTNHASNRALIPAHGCLRRTNLRLPTSSSRCCAQPTYPRWSLHTTTTVSTTHTHPIAMHLIA